MSKPFRSADSVAFLLMWLLHIVCAVWLLGTLLELMTRRDASSLSPMAQYPWAPLMTWIVGFLLLSCVRALFHIARSNERAAQATERMAMALVNPSAEPVRVISDVAETDGALPVVEESPAAAEPVPIEDQQEQDPAEPEPQPKRMPLPPPPPPVTLTPEQAARIAAEDEARFRQRKP